MIFLFRNQKVYNIDILAIHKPLHNLWQASIYNPLKELFGLALDDQNDDIKISFFINKRLKLSDWSFTHHRPDLHTLYLKVLDIQTIQIHNVYNLFSSRKDVISQQVNLSLMETI